MFWRKTGRINVEKTVDFYCIRGYCKKPVMRS